MQNIIHNSQDNNISLEDMYNKMMENVDHKQFMYSSWEKIGDIYKRYSIYETSKYDTKLSSSILAPNK